MDCLHARASLIRVARGEPDERMGQAVTQHLATCGDCRRAWARLDPVAAVRAYGDLVPAPPGLAEGVLTRIRSLPMPRRRRVALWLPAGGVLALWMVAGLVRPLAVSGLLLAIQLLVGGVAVAAQTWALAAQAVHPALPVIAATVVLGEVLVLHRWVRPVV